MGEIEYQTTYPLEICFQSINNNIVYPNMKEKSEKSEIDFISTISVTLCMNLRHLKGKTYAYGIWGLRTRFWAENMELIFFLPSQFILKIGYDDEITA